MTLSVRDVAKRFGPTQALRGAGFVAHPGEVLGVIGPNGSGKSTLLAIAAGLVRPDSGDVIDGERLLDLTAIRRTVFLMPDGITPWAEHPVHEIVRFWRRVHGRSAADAERRIREVRLTDLLGRRVQELSKGERKRFLIALALLASQPVLMLDEPHDGLDLRQMREVAPLLRAEARAGRTVIVSMHQLADAARICDRLALLHAGRIVAEGMLDELRAAARLPGATLEEVFLALT